MTNIVLVTAVVLLALIALGLGAGLIFLLTRRRITAPPVDPEELRRQVHSEIEASIKDRLLEAKEEAVRIRTEADREARETKAQAQQAERRLLQKEENLDRRSEELNRREQSLSDKEKHLDELREQLEMAGKQRLAELERVANMTRQEAQGVLMSELEQELRNEIARKVRQEVQQRIKEEGEAAVLEVGLQGLHPEVVRHLGILRFRTSYGQQVLSHSKEVAHLAAMMASEIGADVRISKMSGLLHDIGKAIDHEVEGSHAVIGADLLQRHGVPAPVVHAVRAHHYDEEPHTLEALLLIAADAISAARPGARRETLEAYIKRLEKLEEIANSFDGVEQSYAIQAGREVRILVKPDQIDDATAQLMARDIAKKIEGELSYPGQIRVTVVRETRAVEYAR